MPICLVACAMQQACMKAKTAVCILTVATTVRVQATGCLVSEQQVAAVSDSKQLQVHCLALLSACETGAGADLLYNNDVVTAVSLYHAMLHKVVQVALILCV